MTNVEKLKELGVYEKFVHNLKTLESSDYIGWSLDVDEYINNQHPTDLIAGSFIWRESPEKHIFWRNIEEAMYEEFDKD